MAATSYKDLAVFGGGFTTSATSSVYILNITNGIWSSTTLSLPRYSISLVRLNHIVLFAGGTDGYSYYSIVDQIDIFSNTWTYSNLSSSRSNMASTINDDLALFAGGVGENLMMSQFIDFFNFTSSSWTSVQAGLSIGRSNLAGTTVGGLSLFAGGNTFSDYSSVVDIYDISTNLFFTSAISSSRSHISSVSIGFMAIFAGGITTGSRASSTVDIYDSLYNLWTNTTLSAARYQLSSAIIGCRAYFVGGFSSLILPSSVIDIYDSMRNTWDIIYNSISIARGGASMVVIENMILFVGGSNNINLDHTTHTYNLIDYYSDCSNNCTFYFTHYFFDLF